MKHVNMALSYDKYCLGNKTFKKFGGECFELSYFRKLMEVL